MKPKRSIHLLVSSIVALTVAHTASGITYDVNTTIDTAVTSTDGVRVGNANPNVTLTVDPGGSLGITAGSIDFGASNEALVVNGTGTLGFVTGNGKNINLNAGSGNGISVQGGGTFTVTGTGGTMYMGSTSALAPNTFTVTGSGSTFTNGNSTQGLNIWCSVSNAQIIVSNGGVFTSLYRGIYLPGRWGGTTNSSLTVSGAGSTVRTNSTISLGDGSGGANNSGTNITLTISGGGAAYSASARISSYVGANNNTATITGSGSLWDVGGGTLYLGSDAGGLNNTLNISNGGSLNNVGSVLMNGTNNQFNLGGGIATATGSAAVNTVTLGSIGALLNINNGRLIARAGGTLVSGTGSIDLKGPAYFANATGLYNTIGVVIGDTTSSGAALIKEGTGTLTISAANTYNGATTVHGGTLVADTASAANILSSASALVLGRCGNFQLKGLLDTERSQVLAGLTLDAGGNGIEVNNAGSAGTTTTLDLRGAGADTETPGTLGITRHGGTVDFKASGGTLGTNVNIKTVQANDSSYFSGILGAWATINDGADLACNNGSDSIAAYTSYTALAHGGTIPDETNNNLRISSAGGTSIGLAMWRTNINTLLQASAAAATIDSGGQVLRCGIAGGILIASGGADLTIGNGYLTAGGGTDDVNGELVLGNFSITSKLAIRSSITDNSYTAGLGVVSLTKSGSGNAELNIANTYSGATYVGAGTLTYGISDALGSGPLTVCGGTLAMGTYSDTVGHVTVMTGSISGSGSLTSTSGFTFNNNVDTTCPVVLDGNVGLVKTGHGTATLSATNTYSGDTNVAAGTLVVSQECLHNDSVITIASGAILNLGFAGTDTVKRLSVNGVQMQPGIYGSAASTADNKRSAFVGAGTLTVTDGPVAAPVLTLSVSVGSFAENAGAAASQGTVSIGSQLGTDLVVNLASSDPTAAVPATSSVTITSSNTSATFWIDAVNNLAVQAAKTVTLTASASGSVDATADVTVTDAGYVNWAANFAGGQAFNVDSDGDGVRNGAEYFMGVNSLGFTANPALVSGKITWPYDVNALGCTWRVTSSTDLSTWSPVSPQPVPSAGKIEYTPTPTADPKSFIRLEVTPAQ
jgi:fibronectin-binding autotransporter adhesin